MDYLRDQYTTKRICWYWLPVMHYILGVQFLISLILKFSKYTIVSDTNRYWPRISRWPKVFHALEWSLSYWCPFSWFYGRLYLIIVQKCCWTFKRNSWILLQICIQMIINPHRQIWGPLWNLWHCIFSSLKDSVESISEDGVF